MTTLFIGLGAMGRPMVKNLASTRPVSVYDVDAQAAGAVAEELGVTALTDLDVLPSDIETVVLMVPNSRIVESLVQGADGLFAKLSEGALVIDMSSSEPGSSQMLAQEAKARGIAFVDAPVSGGVAKAVTGQLAIMVGADDEAYERALPILTAMGTSIHHVGGSGAGDAAKALNNLLSAANLSAAAEVMTAAAAFGIAPEKMLAVINASTGRSQATEVKFPNFVLTGTFASGFPLNLLVKDLGIAQSLTSGAGLHTPVTDTVTEVARTVLDAATSSPDHTEIVRHYEGANNAHLRA